MLGIGLGIAFGIHLGGTTSTYNMKIASVKAMDGQYAYLGAFFFGLTSLFLNMYPAMYKAKVMRMNDGNFRANMFIYKLAAAEASPSVVILEEKGAVGEYNRANRALMHFVENVLPMVISWALNSYVYPLPSFVLMLIYCVGRLIY